jgi:hypothetical protein
LAFEFDLLGALRSEREGLRGRPEHVPSPENVRKVRALVLAGWKVAAIAAEINVSPPTLRKVYFRDLAKARDEVRLQGRARLLMALEEKVAAGDVGAMKALWKIIEDEGLRDLPAPVVTKATAMGKKEQRKAAAAKPSGRWDGLIPPAADLIQ